jgi:hypothetical protein
MKRILFLILTTLKFNLAHSQTVTPVLINGVFNMYKETVIDEQGSYNRNTASAYFSNTSVTVITPSMYVSAGNVKLNNKNIKFNSSDKFYGSKTKKQNGEPDSDPDEFCNTTSMESLNWKVKGENSIPEMNFIYSGPFPTFDNPPVLPSSINKNDTLFIQLNSISNVDSIYVNIWDGYFNGTNRNFIRVALGYESIQLHNGNKAFYVIPTLLSQLIPGNLSYFSIEAVNKEYQTIAGKKFEFNTIVSVVRPTITITN